MYIDYASNATTQDRWHKLMITQVLQKLKSMTTDWTPEERKHSEYSAHHWTFMKSSIFQNTLYIDRHDYIKPLYLPLDTASRIVDLRTRTLSHSMLSFQDIFKQEGYVEVKYSIFLFVFNKFSMPTIGSKIMHTVLQGIEPKGIDSESAHLWTLYNLSKYKPIHFKWNSIDLRIIKKLKQLLEFQQIGQRRLPFRTPLTRNPYALEARGSRSAVSTLHNNYATIFNRFNIKISKGFILDMGENYNFHDNFVASSFNNLINKTFHYYYGRIWTPNHVTGAIVIPKIFSKQQQGYVVALNGWNFNENDYTKIRQAYETHVQPKNEGMKLLLFPNDFFMAPCETGYCFSSASDEYEYNVQAVIPSCTTLGGECQDFSKLLPALFLEEMQRRHFVFQANEDFIHEQSKAGSRPHVKLINAEGPIFGSARHAYETVKKMNLGQYNDELRRFNILGGKRRRSTTHLN
jgi:hypothetical protein